VVWLAYRVAAVRIEESAEDRSWDGAEERADEGTGLPWAKDEGHRAGVHHAGSGNPLPIVEHVHPYQRGRSSLTGLKVELLEIIVTRRLVGVARCDLLGVVVG